VMMPMSLLLFNMLATCSSGDATGKDTISVAFSLRPRPGLLILPTNSGHETK
jgi:hypothetical protein